MKKYYLLFTFMLSCIVSFSQNGGISEEEIAKNKPRKKGVVSRATLRNRNVYRTTSDLKAKYCYKYDIDVISFKKDDTCLISVVNDEIPYLDYTIINEDVNGYVIIEILPRVIITMDDKDKIVRRPINNEKVYKNPKAYEKGDLNAFHYYFAVKKEDLGLTGKVLMTAKIIGTPIVHPFKIRPDNGQEGWNLFGDFTVGYTAGMKFKLGHNPFRENTVTFVFYGAGVGKAKYFTEKDGKLTEKEDGMAITYYQAGVLFTVEKVNFGGFVGFDAMLDKRNDWYYQSKPWFSVGLGYKFK